MPLRIPNDLPARTVLEREGVMLMTEATAARQDIRPLRIALLNLMPNKIKTETQFARLMRRHAAADRTDAGQDDPPHAEEHASGSHARLLQ